MALKGNTLTYNISASIVRTTISNLFFFYDDLLTDYDVNVDNDDDMDNSIIKKAAKKANEENNYLNLVSRTKTILISSRSSLRTSCSSI